MVSQTGYAETGKLTLSALVLLFVMMASQPEYAETSMLTINSALGIVEQRVQGLS